MKVKKIVIQEQVYFDRRSIKSDQLCPFVIQPCRCRARAKRPPTWSVDDFRLRLICGEPTSPFDLSKRPLFTPHQCTVITWGGSPNVDRRGLKDERGQTADGFSPLGEIIVHRRPRCLCLSPKVYPNFFSRPHTNDSRSRVAKDGRITANITEGLQTDEVCIVHAGFDAETWGRGNRRIISFIWGALDAVTGLIHSPNC